MRILSRRTVISASLALALVAEREASAISLPDSGSCVATGANPCLKITNTGSAGQIAVLGEGGTGVGIYGTSTNLVGVFATSQNSTAVYASGGGTGVYGSSSNGVGIEGVSTNNDGVHAVTRHASRSGVFAENLTVGGGGYGVFAIASGTGHAIHGDNTNASGWAGYFNGKVFASGGFTSSDARLKKDIAEISDSLKLVAALRPVTFKWKDQNRGTTRQIGFLAQDLQKVVPEVVDKDASSGMLAVNYAALVPVLAKAVQEQQAIIQAQEKSMRALDARIASLEQRPIVASMFSGGMNVTVALAAIGALLFTVVRRRRQA